MAFDGTGIPLHALDMHEYTGTLSTTANETEPSKIVVTPRYKGAYNLDVRLQGEGTYLEGGVELRDGLNFPTAVTELHATAPQEARVVRLTDDLYVAAHLKTNDDLEVSAISVTGTTPTAGAMTDVNTDDTDSIALCRISDTVFAAAYRDEGGDDYLCVRVGSVSGTTVTMLDELAITATAITEDELDITYEPTSGCLVVAYADSDDDLATIAIPYDSTDTTDGLGTPGSVVEFDAAAPSDVSICPISAGYFFVAYVDSGDSNKVHGRVASVSAAGAIGTPGTEKTIINAAGTMLRARYAENNAVVLGYIDASGDPAIVKCTTSGATGTTITAGTAVVLAAATATDFSMSLIDNTQGVAVWCDDAHGNDVGYAIRFSVAAGSTTTITADSTVDKFVDTSAKAGTLKIMDVACATTGKCVVIYNDADSDLACLVGQYYENQIVDVRSNAASAVFVARIFPLYKNTYTSTAT